ncbi:MAG: hypothetical protein R3F29_12440 [Planctomycetota bacterium]
MTVPSAPAADAIWLHCSPARTVWLRRVPDEAEPRVEKVYASGAMADAEHELAMARAAAGPGVAEYLSAGSDPQSGRPLVSMRHHAGENLEQRVARRGALPAAVALRLLAPVAHTLARLHGLRSATLSNGLCHGDVKPQNLLATADTTLLLDFEHAAPCGSTDGRAFTGGTDAFAPPEARSGTAPNAAFDVFGLGATLAWLLDGGGGTPCPRHPEVEALIDAACCVDPTRRPSAAEFAATAERLAAALDDDPAEACLADWAEGRLATPPGGRPDDPRVAAWARRRRLLARLPGLLQRPAGLPTDPTGLLGELRTTQRVLARFPRHPVALQRRAELLRAVGAALGDAAATARGYTKAAEFDAGAEWLQAMRVLLEATIALPGGLTAATRLRPEAPPGAQQRAPFEFLNLLHRQLLEQQRELQSVDEAIAMAESTLDLGGAERRIEQLAAERGGTSPLVALRRDRLHRLAFYLDRVARSAPNVDRVGPLWDPDALQPLQQIVAAARAALDARSRREGASGAVGLRSLQLTLVNLGEEFPHVDGADAALEALSSALEHLTDQAWQQLAEAEQRLGLVPVPVRPLQLALGRLDTFRMLEAFVDLPDRPRSQLFDGLERLRLGLEQARSARDRLAENAEHALARGHWTTGLFDMERAVAGMPSGSDDAEHQEHERLRERLLVARRTKQEIETALRRNVELAATYQALEDDQQSTFEARRQVLEDRRDCLLFLGLHVPADRADLYRMDLRAVESQLAVEQAGAAEQLLDRTSDPVARLRLTRETLETLGSTTSSSDAGSDAAGRVSGRVVRLLEHWRTLCSQCQKAVDEMHAAAAARQRQRRRMLTLAIVAAVVTTTAVGFALKPWLFGEPAMAADKGGAEGR